MDFAPVPEAADQVGERVLRAAIEVHRTLGAGLLERVYQDALVLELTDAGLRVERERLIPVAYKGRSLGSALRLDLLVEEQVVIEIKSVEQVLPVHLAQLQTYLRLTGRPLGYLLNFHAVRMVDGIHRRIWTPRDPEK